MAFQGNNIEQSKILIIFGGLNLLSEIDGADGTKSKKLLIRNSVPFVPFLFFLLFSFQNLLSSERRSLFHDLLFHVEGVFSFWVWFTVHTYIHTYIHI